jgi:hypothetical protein
MDVIAGAKGETKAPIKPTIVIGATNGAASRLAKILIGDK